MARICELTGKRPMKGSIIWRSGKAKKSGGIGTHITAITKRRFLPNLQRVKAVVNGEVRYIRDRKSTRLNSSHLVISYAVFCLKKKKQDNTAHEIRQRPTT